MADEQMETPDLSPTDADMAAFEAKLVQPEAPAEPVVDEKKPEPEPVAAKDDRNSDGTFKKKRNDPQARIDELTGKFRDEERRRIALEAELQTFKAPKAAIAPPKSAIGEDAEPDPADLTKYPDGQYDRKFAEDLARWVFKQESAKSADAKQKQSVAEESDRAKTTARTTYQTRIAEVIAADPRFLDSLSDNVKQLRPYWMLEPGEQATAKTELAEIVSQHPLLDRFLRYFSDNDPDLQRFATLPPGVFHREFGKLEARLEAAPVRGSAPSAPISQAKPVIKPLTSTPSAVDDSTLDDDLPIEEFIRRGNRVEQRARG